MSSGNDNSASNTYGKSHNIFCFNVNIEKQCWDEN